jgi:hypothetical protein
MSHMNSSSKNMSVDMCYHNGPIKHALPRIKPSWHMCVLSTLGDVVEWELGVGGDVLWARGVPILKKTQLRSSDWIPLTLQEQNKHGHAGLA